MMSSAKVEAWRTGFFPRTTIEGSRLTSQKTGNIVAENEGSAAKSQPPARGELPGHFFRLSVPLKELVVRSLILDVPAQELPGEIARSESIDIVIGGF
tara:strand:- start:1009 stop:1302 length:294 start_codon:yes stop_codon:yes gene_type:complete